MATSHRKRLGLSGVALTKVRNNRLETHALATARNNVDALMDESGYLAGAPFSWVTIVIRYGLVNSEVPVYQPIGKRYGDLPLSIEVESLQLVRADLPALVRIFERAVLLALVHAGKRHSRPTSSFEAKLEGYLSGPG